MEREAIGIGATIEEAQQAACRQLGMETHEVVLNIIVLSMRIGITIKQILIL